MEAVLANLFKVAEVELVYKSNSNPENRMEISYPTDAYNVLRKSWDDNKIELIEQFKIILLDRRNRCLGIAEIATGGMASCIVDPKVVFATALKSRAAGIVLAHNHPSGGLKPSRADIDLTQKLIACGKILDIAVVEHIILTRDGYTSMARDGLMP